MARTKKTANPESVTCPVCNAPAGHPCTEWGTEFGHGTMYRVRKTRAIHHPERFEAGKEVK